MKSTATAAASNQNYAATVFTAPQQMESGSTGHDASSIGKVGKFSDIMEKRALSQPSTPERDGVLRGGSKYLRVSNSPFVSPERLASEIDDSASMDGVLPSIGSFLPAESCIA